MANKTCPEGKLSKDIKSGLGLETAVFTTRLMISAPKVENITSRPSVTLFKDRSTATTNPVIKPPSERLPEMVTVFIRASNQGGLNCWINLVIGGSKIKKG